MELSAQTNFLKGYIILPSQDTIRGYVDYRAEKRNNKLCYFKGELNNNAKRFNPEDIIGFAVEDKDFYERHSFKSRKGEELYGFFKVLLRGKISLLRYQSRYFAKDPNGKIFEVTKGREISEGKVRDDYYGLGILKALMKDCDDVPGVLEMEYKLTPNFLYIFKKYNECVGVTTYVTQKITINPHVDLGIQVSPTIANLSLNSPFEAANFQNKLSSGVGGFASVFIPKGDENLRVVLETTYSMYKYYSYFSSSNTNNDLFVDFSCLKFPVLLRYKIGKLFIDLGVQNQFILNQELRWRVETIQQNVILTGDGQVAPFKKWSNGFLAGVGFKYKVSNFRILTSVRYSNNQTLNLPYKPVFQTIELNFQIQLTR